MKVQNIYTGKEEEGLQVIRDRRGIIADVLYNKNINHVAVITSKPLAIRGDHYHMETVQHILMVWGDMEYWWRPSWSTEPAQMYLAKIGDLITTPPYEVHALRMLDEPTEFVVFSEGKRGGKDYESDTYRVLHSIIK